MGITRGRRPDLFSQILGRTKANSQAVSRACLCVCIRLNICEQRSGLGPSVMLIVLTVGVVKSGDVDAIKGSDPNEAGRSICSHAT